MENTDRRAHQALPYHRMVQDARLLRQGFTSGEKMTLGHLNPHPQLWYTSHKIANSRRIFISRLLVDI